MKTKLLLRVLSFVIVICFLAPVTVSAADDNIAYLNIDNPAFPYVDTIDGDWVSAYTEGYPKVLLFIGTDCGSSMQVMRELKAMDIASYAETIVFQVQGSTDIRDIAAGDAAIPGAEYCEADDDVIDILWDYFHLVWYDNTFKLPLTVVIDGDNVIRMISTDRTGVADAVASILSINPEAPGSDIVTSETEIWNDYEWESLILTNKERMRVGLEPLSMTEAIQKAAHIRADELVILYDSGHLRPDGRECHTVVEDLGIFYYLTGENIATGHTYPGEVVDAWINSPGHYANMIEPDFYHYGGGYVPEGMYGTSWVQIFVGADCRYTDITLWGSGTTLESGQSIEDLGIIIELHCTEHGTCWMPLLSEMVTGLDTYRSGEQNITVYCSGFFLDLTVEVIGGGYRTHSLDNFDTNKFTYTPGQFIDVNENDWYGAYKQGVIARAYGLGIISGKDGGRFDPTGNLRISEAIKMAAVVHNIYNGGTGVFDQSYGNAWYDVYVKYAIENGIIFSGEFSDLNAYCTRAQMAYIFAGSLPAYELQPINDIDYIPDVGYGHEYFYEILRLYQAGVLTGNDASLSFNPEGYAQRSHAAAIIARVVLPELRQEL